MVSRVACLSLACAVLALSATLPATPAAAQSAELERQRAAVFAQMIAAPADPALMRSYAQLSVQLRDFEAAAATLERFVDLDPGNAGARLELAIAYFALGAYAVAEYHLAAVAAAGGLTPEQAATVARYRDEAARREAPNQLSGRVALGRSWLRETDGDGLTGSFELDWRLDMGGRNADAWVTQLSAQSYQAGEASLAVRPALGRRSVRHPAGKSTPYRRRFTWDLRVPRESPIHRGALTRSGRYGRPA